MNNPNPGSVNKILRAATGKKFPLGNDTLDTVQVNQKDTEKIMLDLGRYLALLHSVRGLGFGELDPKAMDSDLKFVGQCNTWYELILDSFKYAIKNFHEFEKQEKKAGRKLTKLSSSNRKVMEKVIGKKDVVLVVIKKHKKMLEAVDSRFLNGNVYMGSIAVKNSKFVGLTDFHQPFLGDPVDDLAYFSVMPRGDKYIRFVLEGWKETMSDPFLDEKMHFYRLLESFRKIIRRYTKHQYLEDYPEPLKIAAEELSYYNSK